MIFSIRVIPRSSRTEVKKEDSGYKVYLSKPAYEGQANAQLIEVLAEYFSVKKYQIKILKGQTQKYKLIQIENVPQPRSQKHP